MSTPWEVKIGFGFLIALAVVTLLAGFFAPYDPSEQNRDFPYEPPMGFHFVGRNGEFYFPPVVYPIRTTQGAATSAVEQAIPVHFFNRGTPYRIAGLIPANRHLFGVDEPSRIFLLGSDALGRDQLSRLLHGGRVTLLAGLAGAAIALLIAVPLGTIAGYFGGWIDVLLMRLLELFLAMPWLYLLFAARAFLPLQVRPETAFLIVIGLIGVLGWARPARLIRGVASSVREREFVIAARSAGASHPQIIARHIVPQVAGVVLTQAALLIPQYILAEVTLSFLGLGVSDPVPSWGNMLQAAQQYPVLINDWWMLAPGIVMIPVFWAFAILADHRQGKVEFRHNWKYLLRERLGA